MNLNDEYPLDVSGFGPTGTGNAPTTAELRMQAMNQFRSQRAGIIGQDVDRYVQAASQQAMRILTGAGNTPQSVRRALWQSSGGQGARDAALFFRRGGMLGYGDPVNYANNINQGIAGGGFMTSIGGTMDGRDVGGYGHVSGQGVIAERMTAGVAKNLVQHLYGSGMPDPSKLNGIDMEEASSIFQTLARRGAVGHMAHLERNASVYTRMESTRNQATNGAVQDGFAGVDFKALKAMSDPEAANYVTKLAEATDNKPFKDQLNKMMKTPDAVIYKDDELRKVSKVMRHITEGMGSLADLYGELSGPQLQRKLEQISGLRITNSTQALQARAMVDELRGAATMSGIDPRAFMDWNSDMQGMMQNDVARAFGIDQRHSTQAKNTTAVIHQQMMRDSVIQGRMQSRAVMEARSHGAAMGESHTLEEIYEDKRQGRMAFAEKYQGMLMTTGGLNHLPSAHKEAALAAKSDFEKAMRMSDPRAMSIAMAEADSRMKGVWADLYGGDFGAAQASDLGRRAMTNAYADPSKARRLEELAMVSRRSAVNVNPITGALQDMGVSGARGVALQIRDQVGLSGLARLQTLGKSKTSTNRRQDQLDDLIGNGMSAEDAETFLGRFFSEDGSLKDGEAFNNLMSTTNATNWGMLSNGELKQVGRARMEALGAGGARTRLKGNGFGLSGILTSLMTGSVTSLSDPGAMALTMEALSKEQYDLPKITGPNGELVSVGSSIATGMDFSEGLNDADLKRLDRVNGGSLGLFSKMTNPATGKAFKSREELIAATKGDAGLTADAIRLMQTHKDYAGLNLRGTQYNMTAISESAREEIMAGGFDEQMKKLGGAKVLAASLGLSPDDLGSVIDSSGEVNLSRFSGDKAGNLGEGLGRVMKLAGVIRKSGAARMGGLAAVNEGDGLHDRMQNQYDELELAMKAAGGRGATLNVPNGKEGGVDSTFGEEMDKLKAAMDKLSQATLVAGGGQVVGVMDVGVLKVEKIEEQ